MIIPIVLLLLMAYAVSGASAQTELTYPQYLCNQPGRLAVGNGGRVTTYPNLPNRVRNSPSFYGYVVGQIPAGGSFAVIGGPQCDAGLLWWQVNYNGLIGWSAEGDGYNTYWLEPAGIIPPPPPPPTCVLQTRLSAGGLARVIPVPPIPNVVRTAPGTNSTGSNSVVIGTIPPGGVFSVIQGPQCGTDGRWWWQVNYNGLIGWTAEGEGYNNYWVEPCHSGGVTCPGFMPSRLTPGGYGAVTTYPNLPNRVRSQPSFDAQTLGLIPAAGQFQIISGPHCAGRTAWWQVNYHGLVGWTAEGQGSTYWLEPSARCLAC
jgi:hypothetical protein